MRWMTTTAMGIMLGVTLTMQPGCAGRTVQATTPAPTVAEAQAADEAMPFGEPFTDRELATVDAASPDAAAHDGRVVRVRGIVADVCAKRGCWMTLASADPGQPIFVKFTCPIDGRLIPMQAIGKPAIVEGTLTQKQVSEAYARHLKEDAGASEEEIAAIVGPQQMWFVAAPAARVYDLNTAETGEAAQ